MVTGPPAALPATTPLASTVARVGVARGPVTVRPVSALPLASFGVAVSGNVPPATTLPVAGLTSTLATGVNDTVTAAAALPLARRADRDGPARGNRRHEAACADGGDGRIACRPRHGAAGERRAVRVSSGWRPTAASRRESGAGRGTHVNGSDPIRVWQRGCP